MTSVTTLLYSANEKFDYNYYLTHHMPLVEKTWTSKGMTSWKAIELDPKSGYCVLCTMEWDSPDGFAKVSTEDKELIINDVPNYAKGKMSIVMGKVIGSS
jgi:uncharacterized protein (TIGR02118 family)